MCFQSQTWYSFAFINLMKAFRFSLLKLVSFCCFSLFMRAVILEMLILDCLQIYILVVICSVYFKLVTDSSFSCVIVRRQIVFFFFHSFTKLLRPMKNLESRIWVLFKCFVNVMSFYLQPCQYLLVIFFFFYHFAFRLHN